MLVNYSMASYYEVGGGSSMNIQSMPPLKLSSSDKKVALSAEAKAMAACKSHKEAERRRRKRINAHLATLRTLLPNLVKTDKASVLGEVVRRVRDLKKATSKLTAQHLITEIDGDGCNPCLLPGDTDEVTLCRTENDTSTLIATLCCEDRPGLIPDLTRALRSIKGKVVKAKLTTVGGRTKSVLWVQVIGGGGGGGGGPEALLRRALKVVVDRPPLPSSSGLVGHFGLMESRMQCMYR